MCLQIAYQKLWTKNSQCYSAEEQARDVTGTKAWLSQGWGGGCTQGPWSASPSPSTSI